MPTFYFTHPDGRDLVVHGYAGTGELTAALAKAAGPGAIAHDYESGASYQSDGESKWREVTDSRMAAGMSGFAPKEVSNVTSTAGFVMFPGLKKARIRFIDVTNSGTTRLYLVLNAEDSTEAAAKLQRADARLIVDLGETVTLEFDPADPVRRIDYQGNAAIGGGNANLLYIEGTAV